MTELREYIVKTRKVNNSIVITLPKELLEAEQIKENMKVKITVKKYRVDGFGILKGMAPFTVEDELKAHE